MSSTTIQTSSGNVNAEKHPYVRTYSVKRPDAETVTKPATYVAYPHNTTSPTRKEKTQMTHPLLSAPTQWAPHWSVGLAVGWPSIVPVILVDLEGEQACLRRTLAV